ncbi:hypothetical protein SPI_02778 [Niveomyces insectorum RCEF 264]|uniref:Uncharacterized protein n=1 Tax=Niveomyces insectorum RCEF 264 TaxID=1081102 RepID=A0A167Y8W4_9HYPO|nr:hypothetical protein SPI_02778 [Niveomyces insectorum RCEF 264]
MPSILRQPCRFCTWQPICSVSFINRTKDAHDPRQRWDGERSRPVSAVLVDLADDRRRASAVAAGVPGGTTTAASALGSRRRRP